MITIVNPPNPPQAVSNKDMMGGMGQLYPAGAPQRIPALDLLYSAAVLRSRGIPVRVVDCLASNMEQGDLLARLTDQGQEYVAIRTSTPTFEWDMQAARLVKRLTGSRIILFGSHVSLFPLQAIRHPFVDAVIVGEPELALAEVIQRGAFRGCEGVWYREDGDVVQAGSRPPIEDLDSLPFPAWDLVPYREYDGTALMRNLKPFVTALASRGCPYACAYCPYPVAQGRKLRVRSPAKVVEELAWLSSSLQVRAVLFRDPEFALQRQRVVAMCEGILQRNLRLAWRCETRLEDLDEELIALMGRAGCIGINAGIESADPEVLKTMHRRAIPLEGARLIIDACRRHGIDTFCFFILGLPGETKASALQTVEYALRLNPTVVQFTAATPYPGTELRRWAEEKGYIEDGNLRSLTSYSPAMRNEHLSVEEIRWLHWYAREALAMRGPQLRRRLLGSASQIVSEIRRWLHFQVERSRHRGRTKAAQASRGPATA